LPVLGLHPCYIAEHQHEHLLQLEQHLQQQACIAIGEIGLDTYVADIKGQDCIKNSRIFLAHNCN
jgi:TatD DNase family protein